MPSRIDILNKTFGKSVGGYSRSEVDYFLQQTAETVGGLSEEKEKLLDEIEGLKKKLRETETKAAQETASLQQKIEGLEKEIRAYQDREQTLKDTLLSAQKLTDEVKARAHKEADLILDAANTKAEHMLSKTHLRLAKIQEDISAAKKLRAQFEMKLRADIEAHMRLLDMGKQEEKELEAAEAKISYLTTGTEK